MHGYCGLIVAGAADSQLLAAPAARVSGVMPAIRGSGAREWRRRPRMIRPNGVRDCAPPLAYAGDCGRYSYPVVRLGFKPSMGASAASW